MRRSRPALVVAVMLAASVGGAADCRAAAASVQHPADRAREAAQAGPEDARRARALALSQSGRYDEAIAAWRRIFLADPADDDARRHLSGALAGAAREAAQADRNAEAADLYLMAMDVVPESRLELAVECADQLMQAQRLGEAIRMYEEALNSGRLDDAARIRALLGLALALSWSGRLSDALQAYEESANPLLPRSIRISASRGSCLPGWRTGLL